MSNDTAKTITTNIVPVQGIFEPAPTFALVSLIGPAGTPFYPTIDPDQSGLNITNSTINSTTIGLTTPAAAQFSVVTLPNAPTASTDAVNKVYVDNFVAGISWKEPVLVATTANITLSGAQTIDSVAVVAGDRVLVKNQSTAADNGIYVVASGSWTRAVGADDYAEYEGAVVFVISGTGNAGTTWYCSAQPGGTLGVTALNWFSLSISLTYTAGTGLTLTGTQFSITNTTVTAGAYGGASKTLIGTVNAQGQLTALSETAIAIANTQVSGLGTMSTQNANSVAVTGGSIDGTTIGSSTASTVRGTTITATTQFDGPGTGLSGTASSLSIGGNAGTVTNGVYTTDTGTVTNTMLAGSIANNKLANSSITINGNTVSLGGSTTVTAQNPYALTIGTGLSGTSYDGSAAVTIANTGVLSIAGTANQITASASTGAITLSLPATINVNTSGNAATATSATSATSATTATNITGGASGSLPYQTGSGATSLLAIGSTGQVLKVVGGLPAWSSDSSGVTVVDDTTTNASYYPLLANATSGNITTEYVSSTKLVFNPSTGNLGIGTSSPGRTLEVKNSTTYQIRVGDGGTYYDFGRDNATGYFNFYGSQTGYTGYIFGGVDGERMRITSAGNVGIGTNIPGAKLDVAGVLQSSSTGTLQVQASGNDGYFNMTGTGTIYFRNGSGFTERMVINSSGNVGIGTSSPATKLNIKNSSGNTTFRIDNSTTTFDMAVLGDNTCALEAGNSQPMLFLTAATERMRIDSTGNALFAKAVRATITTDNDLSFDMNAASNFKCTPTAGGALTFTNITSGQTGNIILVNGSNYAITAAATTKVSATCLATISATGTYWLSYYSDGTNVYVANTGALA